MNSAMSPAGVFGTFLVSLIVIPIIFGFVLKAPKLVALGFIAVLFTFSDSTWGQLETTQTIYGRGTGMFYFSLLNLILLVAGVAALVRQLANPQGSPLAAPISKYFLAFIFLLLSHIVVGLLQGIELNVVLGYSGIINILNMLVFMYLVILAFRSERDQQKLLIFIIALAGIRALYGAARYVFMGGDSANPYRNFEQIDVKIFFFDIGDNFVSCLAAFCAAWLLTSPHAKLSMFKRVALFAFLLLQIAAVALSFRRSSLIGLAFMFALLLFQLPGRQRFMFAVFAAGFLSVIAIVFFQQRLQFAGDNTGGILSSLIYDIAPDKSLDNNRFYELYAAAKSIGGNWLFGLGTWGTFTGDTDILSYHFDKFDFVHSGFGHIVLKAGLVGLVLFCCILFAYTSYYFRHRKYLSGYSLLLADAGFAGFLFWIPSLLVGTPIIEFRTMLLLGFTLALPFIAVGRARHAPRSYMSSYQYAAA